MRDASYRYDIDGLRAVAVLSVILFHINKALIPGGFVGVDIFFVLSGFLITGKIADDLDAGSFSLRTFYFRRIKRIAPAMLVVVLATVLLAQLVLLPADAAAAAKAGLWSVASLTNVYYTFFQDTNYFAQSSAELPLLHLWSLGVEEQFYLLWPLAFGLLYARTRGAALLALIGVAALASFIAGELVFPHDPSFAYYMLPTRAGELLVGAMAALALRQRGAAAWPARWPWLYPALAWLGALGLAVSLYWLREDQVFPGMRAMLPALASAALLLGGQSTSHGVARVLRLRGLRALGLISYSAYLWHWPLLAFYRYGYGAPTWLSGSVLLLLTLALAWLTYATVEVPCRAVSSRWRRATFAAFGAASAAMAALAVLLTDPSMLLERLRDSNYRRALASVRSEEHAPADYAYVCMRKAISGADARDPRCVLNAEAPPGGPSVLLWGDSNAAHYVGMVAVFARHAGYGVRNLEAGTCAPVLGELHGLVDPKREPFCKASQAVVTELLKQTDVVIIAAAWSLYLARSDQFRTRFFDTVTLLTSQGKRVVLLGRVPQFIGFDRLCGAKALSYPMLRCAPLVMPIDPALAAFNAELRSFARSHANVSYFDANHVLCSAGQCSTHSAAGMQLYFDEGHLSIPGGAQLGQSIVQRGGVPAAFLLRSAAHR